MWMDIFLAVAFAADFLGVEPPRNLHPVVEMQDHCRIQRMMDNSCTSGPSVGAYYKPGTGVIVISDAFKPGSTQFQQILVHEATHWLQDIQGRMENVTPSVNCQLEKEAYQASYNWVEEVEGVDPLLVLGFSEKEWDDIQNCSSYATEIKNIQSVD